MAYSGPATDRLALQDVENRALGAAERREARIDEGMIRVSCGVEPADVLVADFIRALDQEDW